MPGGQHRGRSWGAPASVERIDRGGDATPHRLHQTEEDGVIEVLLAHLREEHVAVNVGDLEQQLVDAGPHRRFGVVVAGHEPRHDEVVGRADDPIEGPLRLEVSLVPTSTIDRPSTITAPSGMKASSPRCTTGSPTTRILAIRRPPFLVSYSARRHEIVEAVDAAGVLAHDHVDLLLRDPIAQLLRPLWRHTEHVRPLLQRHRHLDTRHVGPK